MKKRVFEKIWSFLLTLCFMGLVWKIAIFAAKLRLANSNCSWFTMDTSLRSKLDICLDWAIAFRKLPLERLLILPWKRGGVSKLAKIAFFLNFGPQNEFQFPVHVLRNEWVSTYFRDFWHVFLGSFWAIIQLFSMSIFFPDVRGAAPPSNPGKQRGAHPPSGTPQCFIFVGSASKKWSTFCHNTW